MKKIFLLFVVLFFGSSTFAQMRAKKDTIIVYSFPKKALKENTDIFVRFSTDPKRSEFYSVVAYKGETREKFIARIKQEGQEEKKKK